MARLRNLPLRAFAQNQVWCEVVAVACPGWSTHRRRDGAGAARSPPDEALLEVDYRIGEDHVVLSHADIWQGISLALPFEPVQKLERLFDLSASNREVNSEAVADANFSSSGSSRPEHIEPLHPESGPLSIAMPANLGCTRSDRRSYADLR
jgi:hypothetical protein